MPAYRKCDLCGSHNDPGEKCDCNTKRNCLRCGLTMRPGETCICLEQHRVLITFPDGDRTTTRINGTPDSIVQYYRDNTTVTSVLFIATGTLVSINRQEAM